MTRKSHNTYSDTDQMISANEQRHTNSHKYQTKRPAYKECLTRLASRKRLEWAEKSKPEVAHGNGRKYEEVSEHQLNGDASYNCDKDMRLQATWMSILSSTKISGIAVPSKFEKIHETTAEKRSESLI